MVGIIWQWRMIIWWWTIKKQVVEICVRLNSFVHFTIYIYRLEPMPTTICVGPVFVYGNWWFAKLSKEKNQKPPNWQFHRFTKNCKCIYERLWYIDITTSIIWWLIRWRTAIKVPVLRYWYCCYFLVFRVILIALHSSK